MNDIVIVGGGIIGCAIAYECTRRGAGAILLERDFVGSGATGVAAGMLAPQAEAERPGPLLDLGVASRGMFEGLVRDLREETGVRVDMDLGGILRLAHEASSAAQLRRRAEWQRALGLQARRCDPAEVRALAPGLARPPLEAVWLPDGSVDAFALARALALAARARGAAIREGVGAMGLRPREVVTTEGSVHGSAIVLTAGAWTGQLADAPVVPVKGQRLLLRVSGRPPSRLPLFADTCYLVPKAGGHWLAGATMEPAAGFDRRVTLGALGDLSQAAATLCPELAAAEPIDFRAGLRPCTPDGLPLLGPVSGLPGVWIAAGHCRNGILLAPLTARLLVDALLDGKPLPAACASDRFAAGAATPPAAPHPAMAPVTPPLPAVPASEPAGDTSPYDLEFTAVLAVAPCQALAVLADVPRWQAHMPDVRAVEVVGSGEGWRTSDWTVAYLGQEVRWRQRDEVDPVHMTIRSRQVAGTMLRRFDIDCKLLPVDGKTHVQLSIRLEVARFPGLILPAVREVIRRNYGGLIAGIAAALGPASAG